MRAIALSPHPIQKAITFKIMSFLEMGEVVQAELEVQGAYFVQHPISHQNQLGRIYGLTHLAYLLYLTKGFLDAADETPEIAVWLLHR